jgi:1,4-alpha-glucan branching enzyme
MWVGEFEIDGLCLDAAEQLAFLRSCTTGQVVVAVNAAAAPAALDR